MDWWPNADADKISLSQEDHVDHQNLDVKDIDHSYTGNLEVPLTIKTNESEDDRKLVPLMCMSCTSTSEMF